MPINLPGVPFKLTPQDMGGFDIGEALKQGFNLNKQFQEARTMPKKLAEELLAAQLQNKINKPKADYANDITLADLEHTRSGTGLQNIQTQAARTKLQQDKEFQDLLNNNKSIKKPESKQNDLNITNAKGIQNENDFSDNGMPAGTPGIAKSASAYDTFPGRRNKPINLESWPEKNESVIPSYKETLKNNESNNKESEKNKNPALEKMNWIWDNYPQHRKRLKDLGFDKEKSSKNFAPTNTMKEIQAGIDIDAGFVPGTQRTQQFSNPEEQKKYKAAYDHVMQQKEDTANAMNAGRIRRATGLKQDENYINAKGEVVDTEKEATAIRRPYSEREKKEQSGRRSFNITYPFILKSTSYYSGKGSIKRFNDDIANFDTDPKAQKRILNYITASQLVTQGIIKEDATLGGANTNQVYNRLAKSLSSSDLPIKFEQLERQFRLPNSANLKAGLKFQEILNKSLKAGESLPSRTTEYLSGDHLGQMYNPQTGKVEDHLVSPEDWEAFKEAGGY